MRKIFLFIGLSLLFVSCKNNSKNIILRGGNKDLDGILTNYWEQRMQLFPLEATANGYNRYNDKLTITISSSFRDSLRGFYRKYIGQLSAIDSSKLDAEHKISFRLFRYELGMDLEELRFPTNLMPINQFWSFTLDLPQLGSGQGNQPFKSVKDYNDFLKRLSVFPAWTDTAIFNMRQGIKQKWVLPRILAEKVLPQLKAMIVKNTKESIFYAPITRMPDSFSADNKKKLTEKYINAIDSIVIPCYTRLYDFFEKEYLPATRSSTGIDSIPGGDEYYTYCVRYWTTTQLTPDSIYQIGLNEVARIEAEMNKVKDEVGYKGSLKQFFTYLNTDRHFYPFTTPQQVIDSFWNIKKQEDPQLKLLFNHTPKSAFTIRQTEAFRAASASAEYNPPSADGSRPGIFYVPILDAKKYNAVGMETLFLHEAIPGHHYQISIQQENKKLPEFRRFLWYGAYGEGWALYSESLGKELGLYKNPYQYFGHLSDAIHRAIRLVVDVGMHHKGMTREQAIQYMMSHERITEPEATAEIERYMAIPGQALSYKIGQLTISGERQKYEQQLGKKFKLASFHDEVLKDGCLPLNILQEKLATWAKKQ
ncbi:MAG TPA: DUF885 domain-containing protein [Flavipsychrobacter sp.]|nr:DUF885 domain-containing protein [Flavipsychrobacter sp.]